MTVAQFASDRVVDRVFVIFVGNFGKVLLGGACVGFRRSKCMHMQPTVELHVLTPSIAKHLRRHGSAGQAGRLHHDAHVLIHRVGAVLVLAAHDDVCQ